MKWNFTADYEMLNAYFGSFSVAACLETLTLNCENALKSLFCMKITFLICSCLIVPSRYGRVAQWAAVVFADFLIMRAVFAHTADPKVVLLDRQTCHDAATTFFLRPDRIRREKIFQVMLSIRQKIK